MKNQKLIIILLVAILFVVLFPYLLLGTVFTSNSIMFQRWQRNSADQTSTQESTGDPELDLVLSMMDAARGIANYHMFGFDTTWTFSPETREACFIERRSDYCGNFVENAIESPDAYMVDWENTTNRAITAQRAIQGYFDRSDADTVTVVVNVVDYDHKETIYLSVANGIVGYDAVRGIDLRAGNN